MKIVAFFIVIGALFFLAPLFISKERLQEITPEVSSVFLEVIPSNPIQGDPVLITLQGVNFVELRNISLDNTPLERFSYRGAPSALYGFDLNAKPGIYEISAVLSDGYIATSSITLVERERVKYPLGIPEKLGGNTKESQDRLAVSLGDENKILAEVGSAQTALWSDSFGLPLSSVVITDTYGYVRETGAYQIPHKGADFRALRDTPVYAMNGGRVALAKEFKIYGKTVIIDHGLGLQTLYMHLSDIKVSLGQRVERGELIALSGDSGYAEHPHLHLSIRINGVSIDPIIFFKMFDIQI